MEEWRVYKPSRGQYEVSNLGRVRNRKNGKILSGFYYSTGARGVSLGGYLKRSYTVAQLVAYCFLTEQKGRVQHIDKVTDDRPENLEVWSEEYYD